MKRLSVSFATTVSLVLTCLATIAQAKMRDYSELELAELSDVAFVGSVVSVGADAASIRITQVLAGDLAAPTVSVTPVRVQHDLGTSVNFKADETVLIFANKNKADGKQVTVVAGGYGKVPLDAARQDVEIAAAKRVLAIAAMKDEDQKNRAMLAEVRSPNDRLRRESQRYIVIKLSHSELRQNYKDELVSLLDARAPDLQRTGLQAIRFIKSEQTIPRIVELTRSADLQVVSDASMALSQYDTPQSVAALVALTQHDDPRARMRACIDLSPSRRPEGKAAIRRLLDDKDPRVRAMGPRGLVYWLRRNDANDVLPRLVEMLNDPVADVRAAAAQELGECRNSDLVPPLLAALKKEPETREMKLRTLQALYCHYSKGDARAKELIDKDIQLVVDAVRTGGANDSVGPAFPAVGILDLSATPEAREALKWAAESHPNQEIRDYAKRCLARRT